MVRRDLFGENARYRRLILIGWPASGKSSIGRVLANHYGLDFYDLDDEVEKYAGMSTDNIFRTYGEAEFRRMETHVAGMLAETCQTVIATGGGIVTKEENMALLKREGSLIIYLHLDFVRFVTTPKRIRDLRPVLRNASFDEMKAFYDRRLPLYLKYADLKIKKEISREETVAKIVKVVDRLIGKADAEEAGREQAGVLTAGDNSVFPAAAAEETDSSAIQAVVTEATENSAAAAVVPEAMNGNVTQAGAVPADADGGGDNVRET